MKKTILLAAMAACLFATNVFAQKIKGSDTCLPLTQTEAENFMNKNKAAKITVTGGGSGVRILRLLYRDITNLLHRRLSFGRHHIIDERSHL